MRYKKEANMALSVDLQNGYIIIAMSTWTGNNYSVDLYIKHNTIDLLDCMENYKNIKFVPSSKNIYSEITLWITNEFKAGRFDYYIETYNYQIKCFDKGNEFFENERMKNNV